VILDTNVLLRALDGDPGAQGQAARARIAQAGDRAGRHARGSRRRVKMAVS
jgi:predicted nucleic acid-binding protein